MIHVIAIITTLPGKRETVLKEFNAIVPLVLDETGCIEYQPVVDSEAGLGGHSEFGADTYVVIEKWESMNTLKAHSQSAHMLDYGKRVSGLIADRSIHVMENSSS
ncbi:MAG: putative quinol monooxygenase [Granulosicoccus sp.]